MTSEEKGSKASPSLLSILSKVVLVSTLVVLEAGFLLWVLFVYFYHAGAEFGFQSAVTNRPLSILPFGPGDWTRCCPSTPQDLWFFGLWFVAVLYGAYVLRSPRRVLQLATGALMPYPVLIFVFDRGEFYLHFARVLGQVGLGWFSNALLLLFCVTIFCLSTFYPRMRVVVQKTLQNRRRR
jgi:hypothetical protein